MKQIRRNVFETNSSSTHSVCICSASDMERWRDGELYYCANETGFLLTKDEIVEREKRWMDPKDILEMDDEELSHEGYLTYDKYQSDISYYDGYFELDYTSPSGEEIISFGYYGHD